MSYNVIQPLVILTGTLPLIDSKYFELGFAVLLLSVLLWFGRNAIKKDSSREKWLKDELSKKDSDIERKDREILALSKEKDDRYHQLHVELLNLYKNK